VACYRVKINFTFINPRWTDLESDPYLLGERSATNHLRNSTTVFVKRRYRRNNSMQELYEISYSNKTLQFGITRILSRYRHSNSNFLLEIYIMGINVSVFSSYTIN